MFTAKVEDSEGEVSEYEGEEVKYKFLMVDNYEDLLTAQDTLQGKPEGRLKGRYTVAGTWPTGREDFDEIRKDVKTRFCDADEDAKFENMLMRVGRIELISPSKEEYKNIVVFAGKVFIMNSHGQTVDRLNLLR